MAVAAETPAPTSAVTVTVACKVENGLILRVGDMVEYDEPVMGGGVRKAKRWQPDVDAGVYVINGPRRAPMGQDQPSVNDDGFVLTFGVPEAFMERWWKQNKDLDAVRSGLIRYHSKVNELKAQTREARDKRSGLEPLSQSGDSRVPRPRVAGVGSISKRTDD